VLNGDEEYIDKAIEGVVLGFFNQGEVCTCPSRVLVQESIYPQFVEKVVARMENIRKGDPFDTDTMIGAQASREQYDKILSYINIAREEGAKSSPAARTLRMITTYKMASISSRP
jgi:aldehyde dehydrogenase